MDIEENKKLPFLDVLVTEKANNILGDQVYRKPTRIDTYMLNHTIIQHKNSQLSIHLYIEFSPSLTMNIYRHNSTIWNKSYKRTDMIKKI